MFKKESPKRAEQLNAFIKEERPERLKEEKKLSFKT